MGNGRFVRPIWPEHFSNNTTESFDAFLEISKYQQEDAKEQWKRAPGCLGYNYRGWNPAQLYGDYDKPWHFGILSLNNQDSIASKAFFFFFRFEWFLAPKLGEKLTQSLTSACFFKWVCVQPYHVKKRVRVPRSFTLFHGLMNDFLFLAPAPHFGIGWFPFFIQHFGQENWGLLHHHFDLVVVEDESSRYTY